VSTLIAVDIGNSRIKLGNFERGTTELQSELPTPATTLELPITFRNGQFDENRFAAWSDEHAANDMPWLVASVHQGAFGQLNAALTSLATQRSANWPIRRLSFMDLPLHIRVDEPSRVGVDRLLAALAADRLRQRDRAAVIVDLGSAMTVDLVGADGAFEGGAILPGISMSARALAEQTDALPRIGLDRLDKPPAAPGKSTAAAIEAGRYWGAVGAIRELVRLYTVCKAAPPDLFLTGGASAQLADLFGPHGDANHDSPIVGRVHNLPHLVLAGIALVEGVRSL
jgi:type III pantothenate kinase